MLTKNEQREWLREKGTDPTKVTFEEVIAWLDERERRWEAAGSPHPSMPLARGAGMHTDMASTRRSPPKRRGK